MSLLTCDWLRLRRSRGPGWTSVTMLVVTLVLIGGVLPAAYGYGLPHDHIYIGGLPSVSSEDHHHDNPLAVVLGSYTTLDDDAPSAVVPSTSPSISPDNAHVLSEYAGLASLVLAAIGIAVLTPVIERLDRRDAATRVGVSTIDLEPLVDDGPAPPPPRAPWPHS